jgi:hypothetical protein
MALRVPKAPGYASMMKEGSRYTHGKRLNNYLIIFTIKIYQFSYFFRS